MRIQVLFDELKARALNAKSIFEGSGMTNTYNRLDYGFFPLGSGILSDDDEKSKTPNAEITEGGIMVLGNDFGTLKYIEEKCQDNKESKNNKTISNLRKLSLNLDNTFFTNFYLGLRTNEKASMTKRSDPIKDDYKKFCYEFFIAQISFFQPRLIICLGKDVGYALSHFHKDLFFDFKNHSIYKKDVDHNVLGKRSFLFIPHPSFAHINWKEPIREKIESNINSV